MTSPQNITKTDAQWREQLTPEQYEITRQQGTERPGSGEYLNTFDAGTYVCVCCDAPLFSGDTKFDHGCGWPSFTDPVNREHVTLIDDRSHGMARTEVRCAACDAHMGHVFDDGPSASGERYCINSRGLKFIPAAQ